jgi:hypothetical protein
LDIGFTVHLHTRLGTTRNYSATATLHISQFTTAPAEPFSSLLCFQPAVPRQWLLTVESLQLPLLRSSHHIRPRRTQLSIPPIPTANCQLRQSQSNSLLQLPIISLTSLLNYSLQTSTAYRSQSQSQSYFTTGGLPSISSSWRQVLETHDQRFFIPAELFRSQSFCNILSDEKMGLSLVNTLRLCQVYVTQHHAIENSSYCTVYKSSVSPDFAKQIMPILRILCYNGSLVI